MEAGTPAETAAAVAASEANNNEMGAGMPPRISLLGPRISLSDLELVSRARKSAELEMYNQRDDKRNPVILSRLR